MIPVAAEHLQSFLQDGRVGTPGGLQGIERRQGVRNPAECHHRLHQADLQPQIDGATRRGGKQVVRRLGVVRQERAFGEAADDGRVPWGKRACLVQQRVRLCRATERPQARSKRHHRFGIVRVGALGGLQHGGRRLLPAQLALARGDAEQHLQVRGMAPQHGLRRGERRFRLAPLALLEGVFHGSADVVGVEAGCLLEVVPRRAAVAPRPCDEAEADRRFGIARVGVAGGQAEGFGLVQRAQAPQQARRLELRGAFQRPGGHDAAHRRQRRRRVAAAEGAARDAELRADMAGFAGKPDAEILLGRLPLSESGQLAGDFKHGRHIVGRCQGGGLEQRQSVPAFATLTGAIGQPDPRLPQGAVAQYCLVVGVLGRIELGRVAEHVAEVDPWPGIMRLGGGSLAQVGRRRRAVAPGGSAFRQAKAGGDAARLHRQDGCEKLFRPVKLLRPVRPLRPIAAAGQPQPFGPLEHVRDTEHVRS